MSQSTVLLIYTQYLDIEDGEGSAEEKSYSADWEPTAEGMLLTYDEALEEDFSKATQVRVRLRQDGIEISRNGAYGLHALYQDGKTSACTYQTPYGYFDLEVQTHRAAWQIRDGYCYVELHYEIRAAQQKASETRVWMRFAVT